MDKDKIGIKCPKCLKSFEVDIKMLKPGATLKCPNCLQDMKYSKKDIEKELKNSLGFVGDAFKKFGKKRD